MTTLTTPPTEALEAEPPPTAVNEPSMEDILASIRRIIAEDQTNSLGRSSLGGFNRTARPSESAPPPAPAQDAVLHAAGHGADDGFAAPQADAHASPEGEMSSDIADTHRPDEPALVDAPEPSNPEPSHALLHDPFVAAELAAPQPETPQEEKPLISATAGASVTSSFHALAESVLLQDKALVERMTRDELRPLLKTWLDDNLPSIVERLVRIEIERVARGGRGRD